MQLRSDFTLPGRSGANFVSKIFVLPGHCTEKSQGEMTFHSFLRASETNVLRLRFETLPKAHSIKSAVLKHGIYLIYLERCHLPRLVGNFTC